MRMGNYLCERVDPSNMSAKRPRLGVAHPTVVPANHDPDRSDRPKRSEESERDDLEADVEVASEA